MDLCDIRILTGDNYVRADLRFNFRVVSKVNCFITLYKQPLPGEKKDKTFDPQKYRIGEMTPQTKCMIKSAIIKNLSVKHGYKYKITFDDSSITALLSKQDLTGYFYVNQLKALSNNPKFISPKKGDILKIGSDLTVKIKNPGYKKSDTLEFFLCRQDTDYETFKMTSLGKIKGDKDSVKCKITAEKIRELCMANLYSTNTDYFYSIMVIVEKGKDSDAKLPSLFESIFVFSIFDESELSDSYPPEP